MTRAAAMPVVLLVALAGCEAQKSSNPLSPSVAGPIGGVEITPPKLLEPGQGNRFKESQQPIALLIENASSTGVRPITYLFEVASDEGFTSKVFARGGVPGGEGGRTSVQVDRLDLGRAYWWRARAEDGANSSQYATAQFEVLPRPLLDPPSQRAPVNNDQTASRRPELIVGSSTRNDAIGNVFYEFQIAANVAFSSIVAAGTRSEAGATTSFTPDGDLAAGTTYFWRVRASDDEFTSRWSDTQSFRTPVAAPAPGPGPAPGPTNPGGPCDFSTGDAIVGCERSKFGHMNDGELVEFLRRVADSLNRNGIAGGRFGLLLKEGGANCHGYSCDIICSGNGGSQRQWDVVGDVQGAQSPGWSELAHVTVRVCEIR